MLPRTLSVIASVSTFATLIAVGLAVAGVANALPVTAGALGAGQGCADIACGTEVYQLASSGGATGTIDLDTGANTLNFSITIPSSTFNAVGGSDNGITSIDFVSTVYSGSVSVSEGPPNSFSVDGGQFGQVNGSIVPTGAGVPTAVAAAQSILSGSCNVSGGSVTCGFVFSPPLDFNASLAGNTRYFSHTLNATAVPEPTTAALLGLGIALGTAAHRRR